MMTRLLSSNAARVIYHAGIVILITFMITPLSLAFASVAASLAVDQTTGTVNPVDPCPDPRNSAVYKTIQKAITCAIAGDTITVSAGTYNENVMVDRSLTLLGPMPGWMRANPAQPNRL